MKIKAKNPNIASMKLIVPIDGLITIDAKGETEVSAKCAVLLVNNTNDWEYVGKAAKGVTEESEEETTEEGTENVEKSERDLLEEKVKAAKVSELKDMCVEAEFPEEEWKNLTKNLLAAYILKKYDEATTIEEEDVEEESAEEEEED